MTQKPTVFNIGKTISKSTRLSVYDRIVPEVESKEIPAKYIEKILVQYHDGSIVELVGDQIKHPIPLNKESNNENLSIEFRKMKDVKIFIDIPKLEYEVDGLVEQVLGRYC